MLMAGTISNSDMENILLLLAMFLMKTLNTKNVNTLSLHLEYKNHCTAYESMHFKFRKHVTKFSLC